MLAGIELGRGYHHKRAHHSAKAYVMGDAHTKSVEGFWSLIKRGIGGIQNAVSQEYLRTYSDEYTHRLQSTRSRQPDLQVDFG